MRLLEAPNSPFRQRTVESIDRARRVGPTAQSALELAYAHPAFVADIARAISEQAIRRADVLVGAAGLCGRFTPIRSTSRKARPRQAQQKRRGQCACRRHTGRSEGT